MESFPAPFAGDLAGDFALALDHHDGLQARPVVSFLQPADIMNDGVISCFYTPVIGIDRFVGADRRVLVFRPRTAFPDCPSAQGCNRPSCRRPSSPDYPGFCSPSA
jgi:hypothetical protein